ncbi:uncharacterized protein [Clytia hemisphaerica]|uniref:Uncharacterized protein n=1 Tax=Clytia hemisphaerica TaxID=252671 RepID=A0A7M5XDR2_9CNID
MASAIGVQTIVQKLSMLQPKPIDPTKCHPNKSLYWQIIRNNQTVSNRQAKQFNLGNTRTFTDPIKAAMFLLQREYGDSELFKNDVHKAVFIPPTFVSQQYSKKSTVAILDYEVKKDMDRLLDNLKVQSPDYWLTKELQNFMQTQNDINRIDTNAFDQWVVNLKIMYLVVVLKSEQVNLLSTVSDRGSFIQTCINEIPSTTPEPALKVFLKESQGKKNFKKLLKQKIEENPPQESNLRWIFELELSELGEQLEHWFYNQLLPLKDDILQDTVILSSVNFLTNVRNKVHKEADFLIISWQRKLIISVEMKRELTNDRVFDQLDSNHQLLEERLGDQLQPGWTFFPIVCVQNSYISIASNHFITMETVIKPWLASILDNYPIVQITQKPTPLDQVQKLLKIIVFSIHVSKKDLVAPITSSNWVEYIQDAIENVSTSDNILFYSNQQMAALNNNDPRYNRLIISGPFGVGKSILLRDKAIQLNKQPEYKGKVMYALGERFSHLHTMLNFRMKVDLEEKHGIKVEEIITYDQETNHEELIKQVNQDGIKALFCDEFDTKNNESMRKIMKMVDFLWIVPSTDILYYKNFKVWKDEFSFLDLSQNFRNSRKIVEMTKFQAFINGYQYKEGIVMPPDNFPAGCEPIFVDSFGNAIKEARRRTKDGILVIDPRYHDKIYNQIRGKWKMYVTHRNDFTEKENPYKFLQEGNVLIVDEDTCYGFEWTTVILFERKRHSVTYHSCNEMMRCSTNLIIIKEKYK